MSPPEKQARVSQAQELSADEKNVQFQRGVLNMMQLHPQGNVLADLVFERMPIEAFVDMKKILQPENGAGYDSLLSFASCQDWASKSFLFFFYFLKTKHLPEARNCDP